MKPYPFDQLSPIPDELKKNPLLLRGFFLSLCMANSLSISDLQTIVYEKTATAGLFLNSGPNQEAFDLQAIIDDYNHCLALNPPDTVRAQQLLTFANQNFG